MANFQMGGFQSIPPVVKNLLIVNVLIWVAQLTFKQPFEDALALRYASNPEFGVWQLVTYMFLHSPASFLHILFNMFALWMFGSSLENIWGSKRFLLFYIICGIGAGLVQLLANKVDMMIVEGQFTRGAITQAEYLERGARIFWSSTLGASGAVMGIFAAFAYLFPNTPLVLFPIPIPIKAKYVMMGLIALDLFGGFSSRGGGGGIAHFAHIGGALIGLILVITMNRNNRRTFY